MGSNISKIGDPRSIWLDDFKLTIQDDECNMAQTPTFETTVSPLAPLRTDVGFSHNAVHAILTAGLLVVFHIQRDVSIAIRKSALYPKMFDLPKQMLILNGTPALGLIEPDIEYAGMNFQDSTLSRHWILLESCLCKRILLFDSLAKYAAAAFNISRSSATRRSRALSWRSSSYWPVIV